jgi:DNA-binding response OmpR family regulator
VKQRVLLVEDEPGLARALADNLREDGYVTEHATRGDEALDAILRARPDLVILDVMLPGRSGFEIVRELRDRGERLPVLLLTARGEVTDRIRGLELGADDYLPKPFAMAELLARVRALLRRTDGSSAGHRLVLGDVSFDFRALSSSGGHGPPLTTHDLLVLKILADRRGEVVSRLDIVEEVCGLHSEATLRTVDNHIMALRRALGEDPRRPRWLHTIRGEGYRLTVD